MAPEFGPAGEPVPPPVPSPEAKPPADLSAEQALMWFVMAQLNSVGPRRRSPNRRTNPKFVPQILDFAKLLEQNRHKEATDRLRTQYVTTLVLFVAVLVFVLLFGWLALTYSKGELILPILTVVVGLVGVGFGGYGFGRSRAAGDAPKPPAGPGL